MGCILTADGPAMPLGDHSSGTLPPQRGYSTTTSTLSLYPREYILGTRACGAALVTPLLWPLGMVCCPPPLHGLQDTVV